LLQFSSALSQYAAHGHTIREQLKAIRTREEALDELRRRRRTVHRKADDAERKLSKMSPEHKNMDTQTELLYRLQDEIRTLDSEIMTEEAQLGDFKRAAARRWLGLKFGGLSECSERGGIIGDYGKLLVSEIPEDITQPGMPRNLYYGHTKINGMVNEALQSISQVQLSTAPGINKGPLPPPPKDSFDNGNRPQLDLQLPSAGYAHSANTLPTPAKSNPLSLDTPISPQFQGLDDFGVRQDQYQSTSRFATVPAKPRAQESSFASSAPPLLGPPSLNTRDELGESFSLSIAEALDGKKELASDDPAAKPWRGRLSGDGGNQKLETPVSAQPPTLVEPQASTNPWASPPNEEEKGLSAPRRPTSGLSEDGDDALLAYMTSVDVLAASDDEHQQATKTSKGKEVSTTTTTTTESVPISVSEAPTSTPNTANTAGLRPDYGAGTLLFVVSSNLD